MLLYLVLNLFVNCKTTNWVRKTPKRFHLILTAFAFILLVTVFVRKKYVREMTPNSNVADSDKHLLHSPDILYRCFNTSLAKFHEYVNKVNFKQVTEKCFQENETYFMVNNILTNPNLFRMIIQPKECLPKKCNFLVVLMPSVIEHQSIRDVIRTTWGSKLWPHTAMNADVRFVFMFGRGKNSTLDRALQEESYRYGDILQEDFFDSYRNLTLKILLGFKWVMSNCPGVKFVLKADEDTFVNIPLLVDFLIQSQDTFKMSVIGHIYPCGNNKSPVWRTGRWGVSKDLYPMQGYPMYASGNTYVMSSDLVASVLYISQFRLNIPIEDAYITGILRKIAHGKLINVSGFTSFNSKKPNSCSFIKNGRISATKLTEETEKQIWEAIKKNAC